MCDKEPYSGVADATCSPAEPGYSLADMHALTLQTAKEKEPTACRRVVFLAGGNAEALGFFPFEGNIKGDRIRCMCRIRNASLASGG